MTNCMAGSRKPFHPVCMLMVFLVTAWSRSFGCRCCPHTHTHCKKSFLLMYAHTLATNTHTLMHTHTHSHLLTQKRTHECTHTRTHACVYSEMHKTNCTVSTNATHTHSMFVWTCGLQSSPLPIGNHGGSLALHPTSWLC